MHRVKEYTCSPDIPGHVINATKEGEGVSSEAKNRTAIGFVIKEGEGVLCLVPRQRTGLQ